MKPTIMALTFGRFEMTKQVFDNNLANAGMEYDLIICDQGLYDWHEDSNKEMRDYLRSLNPRYLRLNNYNEGVPRALNQLLLRTFQEDVVFMPNDIMFPDNWLKTMHEYASDIPKSGIVGFDQQVMRLPEIDVQGSSGKTYKIASERQKPLDGCEVLGAVYLTRQLINTIGFYDESFHPYGCEDTDYCYRSQYAGYVNYYIPGLKAVHVGEDNQEQGPYKEAKNKAFFDTLGILRWKMANYGRTGLYIPAPMIKDPLL